MKKEIMVDLEKSNFTRKGHQITFFVDGHSSTGHSIHVDSLFLLGIFVFTLNVILPKARYNILI
jgi:hypothetical protein